MTSPTIPILCSICSNVMGFNEKGVLTCRAFKNGIPSDILSGEFDHRFEHEGDEGILFEIKSDVKLNQIVQEVFEQTLKLNHKCKAGTVDDSNKCGYVADKASFRGLSKEDTKLVINSIQEAKEKYGLEKLSFLGTKKIGKNAVGAHGKITKTFFGMEMPNDEYDITIDKNLLKNLKSGYNAVPSLKGVVDHEIGHFIMETIHKNIPTGEIREIKYKSGKVGRIEGIKSLRSSVESAYDRMSKDDIEKFISTYAKKDYKEFGAEVYSKAMNEGWGFIENMPNREDMLNIKDCFEKSELKNYREPIFDVPSAPTPMPKPKPKKSEQVGLDTFKLMSGIVQDIFDEAIKLNYKCPKGTKDPNTNECSTGDSPNWSDRTHDKVVDNPFIEGASSKEKVKSIKEFIDKSKDKYNPTYIKFYHGTDPSIDIENEGLLPTSKSRRRSFQSTSGYVYLANTPERARVFGEMGNQGKAVVYEVIVPGHAILADKDQLNNQRATGINVGDSVAESIVYGGGVRVKGKIDPWQIKRINV